MDSIKLDEDLYESILGFRKRLAKTYVCLLKGVGEKWKGDKNDWRKVIDH